MFPGNITLLGFISGLRNPVWESCEFKGIFTTCHVLLVKHDFQRFDTQDAASKHACKNGNMHVNGNIHTKAAYRREDAVSRCHVFAWCTVCTCRCETALRRLRCSWCTVKLEGRASGSCCCCLWQFRLQYTQLPSVRAHRTGLVGCSLCKGRQEDCSIK